MMQEACTYFFAVFMSFQFGVDAFSLWDGMGWKWAWKDNLLLTGLDDGASQRQLCLDTWRAGKAGKI